MVAELEEGPSAYVPLPVSLCGGLDTAALRIALTGVVATGSGEHDRISGGEH